jgi:mRNA interferase HigB
MSSAPDLMSLASRDRSCGHGLVRLSACELGRSGGHQISSHGGISGLLPVTGIATQDAMRIIARRILLALRRAASRDGRRAGKVGAPDAAREFRSMTEVQAEFRKAKVLDATRVRFEIAGGNYRLIASFHFRRGIVYVKFLGTHAEYDRIDAFTVSLY